MLVLHMPLTSWTTFKKLFTIFFYLIHSTMLPVNFLIFYENKSFWNIFVLKMHIHLYTLLVCMYMCIPTSFRMQKKTQKLVASIQIKSGNFNFSFFLQNNINFSKYCVQQIRIEIATISICFSTATFNDIAAAN